MRKPPRQILAVSSGSIRKSDSRSGSICAQHVEREGLVAGLHVGQRRVVEHVREQRGERRVPHLVPEQVDALRTPADQPRAEDDVGVAVEDRLDEPRDVGRVVLEIRVLDHDDLPAHRARRPCAARRPCPGCGRGGSSSTPSSPATMLGRAVPRAVVDDHDLRVIPSACTRSITRTMVSLLVVGRDDHAELPAGRSRSRAPPAAVLAAVRPRRGGAAAPRCARRCERRAPASACSTYQTSSSIRSGHGSAAPAVHLGPAGDARQDLEPAALVLGVLLDLVAQRRPRADEAHVAPQHVDQLGQLVERRARAAARRSG